MNRITRIAAIALSFAAAGSAFAESPNVLAPQAAVSTLSRAQVQADALQFKATVGEAELNKSETVASVRSRDDVRAETVAAMASGEAQALASEIGTVFKAPKRATVITIMAQASR